MFRRGFGRMGGETPDKMRRRMQWLALAFSLFLMVLFVRLWHLQVLQGEKFRALSENNRIAYRVVRSPRGLIYDSSGRLLADNRASFNLYLVKENSTDLDEAVRHLARMTDQPYDELREKVRRANPFRPFLIKADVDRNTVAFFEEHRPDFPGVYTQIAPLRNYRTERRGGHVLGYLGEVDGQQLQELTEFNYRQGDLLGKYGVERSFENYLRGETGFKQVEVDAYGRELRVVRPFVEKPGSNLHLTINDGLQAKAEELFRDFEGGIVALDPNDGAILAMVSNPPIDPNQFAGGIRSQAWRSLMSDPLKPLENRSTRGQYPPGSIFKIVMAFATLNEKVMRPDEKVYCSGSFPFGKRVFADWKEGGHGPIDMVQSLAQSCDVYYYTAGNKLGIERIARYSHMFGLGEPTGYDPAEKGGLVPSDEWKRRRFKEKWYPGETISVSIGQGFNLITPMQAANLIATVANGGTLWKPFVVRRVTSPVGEVIHEHLPTPIRRIPIGKEVFDIVREGLREVVNGPRGTAKKAALADVIVSGKTGTAQTVRLNLTGRKAKPEDLPRKFRDHGWFVAFAPFDDPKIAIAILGEHTGKAGSSFAPLARDLIAFYLGVPVQPPQTVASAPGRTRPAQAAATRQEENLLED
ncbi:MAG: penicillin-binding protein 2 [Candidatus Tectomicrobia bacterium RIFCSPLOWO2_12_FULL_69_37]|nr:MAG: penicillin-binding protein 2 [Candidatus Tectomicrobia bacterium RIFCSPLOWO2_02_FULL_70_19]OGL66650.1 MAG: penicillin-binding protein 2 [Candidatus Tectomicrobia bacterium RIFCSPLOWO2_12_FULL_69_37]